MNPTRIQRQRTRGWRAPSGAKYVGRGTRWGNPWVVVQTKTGWAVNWVGEGTPNPEWTASTDNQHAAHVMAVGLYQEYAERTVGFATRARVELAGRDLMCWCPLPAPGQPDHCHASVLLQLANHTA